MKFYPKIILLSMLVSALSNAGGLEQLKDYPALVNAQESGFLTVKTIVPVEEVDNKLAAFVQTDSGQNLIYWLDTKDGYINTGALLLNNGVNLTTRYLSMMQPSVKEEFDVLNSKGLILGNNKITPEKSFFVFYEPFCGYCKKLHQELQPYIEKGLEVKMIPVSFLSSKSPDIIATLEKSDDLLRDLVLSDSKMLKITQSATPDVMNKIQGNLDVMRALGINGTPGVVYVDDNGKYIVGRGVTGNSLDKIAMSIMAR